MLHLRSGDDIAPRLRAAGIPGDFARHGDPFCSGPLPADPAMRHRLRLAYLMDVFQKGEGEMEGYLAEQDRALAQAAEAEAVTIWVDTDPYDQMLLVYWLAHLGEGRNIAIVQSALERDRKGRLVPTKLSDLKAKQLAAAYGTGTAVTPEAVALAKDIWAAVTAPEPTAWSALLQPSQAARLALLPSIGPVLRRLAQEFPWIRDGLGLTERRLLQGAAKTAHPQKLAAEVTSLDPAPYLAMPLLYANIRQLLQAPVPLLAGSVKAWVPTALRLKPTERALAALAGDAPVTPAERGPRWVGGTLLQDGSHQWQWDEAAGAIEPKL